ncbi:hypothetical protein DINM_000066, partial [Dirofilaria immitis]|nr:hypothetical protein [Dirofilaria immitis]
MYAAVSVPLAVTLLSCVLRLTRNACSKEFNKISILKRHRRIHTGQKPFECDICSKGFTERDNLKIHRCIQARNHTSAMHATKDLVIATISKDNIKYMQTIEHSIAVQA